MTTYVEQIERGRMLAAQGHYNDAMKAFQTALALQPNDLEAIFQLGNLSKAMGFFENARKWYDVALMLSPGTLEIEFNKAECLRLSGHNEEALAIFETLKTRMAESAMFWNNIGSLYQQMMGATEAIQAFEKAVSLDPKHYEAWNNLGLAYFQARGDARIGDKWIDAFCRAEEGLHGDPGFHVNRATCHFWVGNIDAAVADYAYRHDPAFKSSVIYAHDIPRWKGEDLTGKTLLIGEEQGIGDQITFASTLASISAQAKHVILEVNPKIASIIARSFPAITVVEAKSEIADLKRRHDYDWLSESVDYFTPFGDVFFRTISTGETALEAPYLLPDPDLKAIWQGRLKALGPKPKVGLSWRSSKIAPDRATAYMKIDMLEPLFAAQTDIQFINIQYGDCGDELASLSRTQIGDAPVIHFDDLDLFDDLENTLALIDSLDMVLSVRNTQACLAGAVGRPTISYYGSFLQLGRTYTDPVFPTLLACLPHPDEAPILEQFSTALCDFSKSLKAAQRRDGVAVESEATLK